MKGEMEGEGKMEAEERGEVRKEEVEEKTEEKREEAEKERLKREIVSKIMEELELKGVSKRRLLEKLVEQYDYDEAKVRYKAKRAFITYRYAKLHAAEHAAEDTEAGGEER